MNSSPTKTEKLPKEEYDKIPVHYCADCLSLAVMRVAGVKDAHYCDACGCTNIAVTSIDEWETLYKARYGFKYLNNTY